MKHADIRQWFCTYELPHNTFRSSNGQIYPWFHGIFKEEKKTSLVLFLIRICF
mgnify:CR=1 FL=1